MYRADDEPRGVSGRVRGGALRRSARLPRPMYLTMDRPHGKPRAREILRDWSRAPGYSIRAAEFLELARCASASSVRNRYTTIAQHYLTLAEAEKRAQLKKSQMTPYPLRKK